MKTTEYNNFRPDFKTFHETLRPSIFPYLTLPLKSFGSTQGHHLNNGGSSGVPNATYKVARPCPLVLQKILNVFTIYSCGGHTAHVTWTV